MIMLRENKCRDAYNKAFDFKRAFDQLTPEEARVTVDKILRDAGMYVIFQEFMRAMQNRQSQ